jgi:hypothetical protein
MKLATGRLQAILFLKQKSCGQERLTKASAGGLRRAAEGAARNVSQTRTTEIDE